MNLSGLARFFKIENIKRHSYVIKLISILVGAYFTASAVNSIIIPRFLPLKEMKRKIKRKPRQVHLKEIRDRGYYDIIIDRNIFDSTDQPVPGAKVLSDENLQDLDNLDMDLAQSVPSNLPVKLIGTMVMNNPKWSIALITGGGNKDSNVYKVKGILLSSAIILKVLRNKVILKNEGRLEFLEIKDEGKDFITESKVAEVGVNQVSDNKFVVNRRELDAAFADLSKILTQARVVPYFEDGKTVGFRIFAIQPGSIYKKLGLQNNDIIARVNGVLIDDPTKGLQLFNSLKTERKIDLDIIRDKVKQSISYEIK